MNLSPKRKNCNPARDRISELPKDVIHCILEHLPIRDAARTSILSRKWRTIKNLSLKRKNRNPTCDRISELPRDVIDCILEHLPLGDAARTSILSRKWRYNWATLPQLVFDYRFFEHTVNNKVLKEFEFMNIINKILLLHCGPILKFVLHDPNLSVTSSPDIDQWILFLSRNGIKVLTLEFSDILMPYKLPSYVFSCLELTHLKLSNCTLNPLTIFRGFPNLVFLDLFTVTFEANIFETFVSGSPLLESLTIQNCVGIYDQNIDAPNLKSFNFLDNYNLLCLRNTPNLSVVSFQVLTTYMKCNKTTNLIKFLGCLPRIEKLTVGGNILKFLAAGSAPKRLPSLLEQLKYLTFSVINFNDLDEISWALCLIGSSPNLRRLDIMASTLEFAVTKPVDDFLKEQNCLDGTLNRLQIVEFRRITGVRPEMEFIKLLLASSPLLETMIITRDEYHDFKLGSRKSKELMKELMRFCRASPKAEIIYMDPQ